MANDQKMEGLDALRGILSLAVVVAHAWQVFVAPVVGSGNPVGLALGLIARGAVLLFFCLSGYVIAFSVSKNIQRNGAFHLFSYAKSRVMRVIPPLAFVILAVYAVTRIVRRLGFDTLPAGVTGARDIFAVDIEQQFNSLYYLCGISDYDLTGILNGPLWSLKYEIQLYVILGLGAAICFSRGLLWRVCSGAALAYYLYYVTDTYLHYPVAVIPYGWGIRMQYVWFLVFAAGAVSFIFSAFVSNKSLIWIIFASAAVSAALFAGFSGESVAAELDSAVDLIAAQLSFAVAGAALVARMARGFVKNGVAALGDYSFTLYIIHFPVLLLGYFALVRFMPHYGIFAGLLLAVLGFAACVWIARASYEVVEHSASRMLAAAESLFRSQARSKP